MVSSDLTVGAGRANERYTGTVNKNLKFGLLIAVILGTLGWLAMGGISQTASYYKEIPEIKQMGTSAVDKRLRVVGDVEPNSIKRQGRDVYFTLVKDGQKLNVVYSGIDPLPDTFKDSSQALADGKLDSSGVF